MEWNNNLEFIVPITVIDVNEEETEYTLDFRAADIEDTINNIVKTLEDYNIDFDNVVCQMNDEQLNEIKEYLSDYCSGDINDILACARALAKLENLDIEAMNACVEVFGMEQCIDWAFNDVDLHDSDEVNAVLEALGASGLKNLLNDEILYLPDVCDYEAFGRYMYDSVDVSMENLVAYIDIDMLSRDLEMDLEEDEIDNISDEYGSMYDYAINYVENGLLDNYDPYFDYETYGLDITTEITGGVTNYGTVILQQ